jgi:DNA-binding NarL/FixJ family response regulator
MNSLPTILLFEPRILIRTGLAAYLMDAGHPVVVCLSAEQLTEAICLQTERPRILLIGAGGLGESLFKIVRMLYFAQKLSLKSLVYLPRHDGLLTRLFISAGALQCLTQDALESGILPLLQNAEVPHRRVQRFSPSELNVLISYASGLQTSEIAVRRNCNVKTVYAFKLKICSRLEIETKNNWLELITRLAQLKSFYE